MNLIVIRNTVYTPIVSMYTTQTKGIKHIFNAMSYGDRFTPLPETTYCTNQNYKNFINTLLDYERFLVHLVIIWSSLFYNTT